MTKYFTMSFRCNKQIFSSHNTETYTRYTIPLVVSHRLRKWIREHMRAILMSLAFTMHSMVLSHYYMYHALPLRLVQSFPFFACKTIPMLCWLFRFGEIHVQRLCYNWRYQILWLLLGMRKNNNNCSDNSKDDMKNNVTITTYKIWWSGIWDQPRKVHFFTFILNTHTYRHETICNHL